jgi:hypothetical protein
MVVLSALLPGALAFIGALAGHLLSRRSARELDRWRHREETMRLMRWAVELAGASEKPRSRAGLSALTALLDSPLLDEEDGGFLTAVAFGVRANVQFQEEVDPDDRADREA